ncbi:MAG: hypothetical protein JXP34_22975 [Planctomycetes bacterium]|nr:hypothetical protein [Planctomycetota bacterium]
MKGQSIRSSLAALLAIAAASAARAAEAPTLWTEPLPPAEALAFAPPGNPIALAPGADPIRIEVVRIADCRNIRAFLHNPIDGRLDSRHYSNRIWEYPLPYGDGVHYAYNGGDGLHIELADDGGFDALLVRGGFKGRLFRDSDPLAAPAATGEEICAIDSPNLAFRRVFPERVRARRLSFYGTQGYIADVSFCRIERTAGPPSDPVLRLPIGGIPKPPEELEPPLRERSGRTRMICAGAAKDLQPGSFPLAPYRDLHIFATDKRPSKGIAAIGFDLSVDGFGDGDLLAVRIQDPLNPSRELAAVDLALGGSGRYRFVIDIPDQVVLEHVPLWITLACGVKGTLSGPAEIQIHLCEEKAALPAAIALRKLLLKGYFYALSEPRPWEGLRRGVSIEKYFASSKYQQPLRELYYTLAVCRTLAPEDDVVRQYAEWLHRKVRALDPFPVDVPSIEGVPRWAVLARAALVEAQRIAAWWLDNRLVPNGELGGRVGDDSDFYQNLADLPRIDDGPLGARILDAAERLANLAERTTLERGINKVTMDPLHAYEEGINQRCLVASWRYGDPVALERVWESALAVEKHMMRTEKGHLHFRSGRIGARLLDDPPKPDIDGHTHPLLLHPLHEAAWYNRNPRAVKILSDWAKGWIAHHEPKVYPTAIDVEKEEIFDAGKFPGQGGYGSQGEGFLAAFGATGDAAFLDPFRKAFEIGNYANADRHRILPDLLRTGAFADLAEAMREHYGRGKGYISFVLTGDETELERDLEETIREYRRYPHMYTAAEPFTDRIFLTHLAPVSLAYLGAFATRNKFARAHAASYEGLGTDFAALVRDATTRKLRIALVNLSEKPIAGAVRVWRLEHGRYRVRLGSDGDGEGEIRELFRAARIPVRLPPREVQVLACDLEEALDPLLERADLAVSWDEKAGITVHNIGAKEARAIAVAVVRDGREVAREAIPSIEAPLDLLPRRVSIALAARPGDRIVVDPDGKIPEISEENNIVVVPRPKT